MLSPFLPLRLKAGVLITQPTLKENCIGAEGMPVLQIEVFKDNFQVSSQSEQEPGSKW